MSPRTALLFILATTARADCFCGDAVEAENEETPEAKSQLSDLITFLDMAANRLNARKLVVPDSNAPIRASPVTSMRILDENEKYSVEVYFRFSVAVPAKFTFERLKLEDHYEFSVTFTELRSQTSGSSLVTQVEKLTGKSDTELMMQTCRFFYVSAYMIYFKNFGVDLDSFYVAYTTENNVRKPLRCTQEQTDYGFYMSQSVIVSLASLVQSNPKMIDEDLKPTMIAEEVKGEFEDDLDTMIRMVDEFEESMEPSELPPVQIEVENSDPELKAMKLFSDNMKAVPNKITLKMSENSESGPGRMKRANSMRELRKRPEQPDLSQMSRSLDDEILVKRMRKPSSPKTDKSMFIRSQPLFTRPEDELHFGVGDPEKAPESEGGEKQSEVKEQPLDLMEEVMEEETILVTANPVYGCDYYTSDSTKYYLGLFDSIVPHYRRLKDEGNSGEPGSSSFEGDSDIRDVVDVYSAALDNRLASEIRVIYDSAIEANILESLRQNKPVLRRVNSFNARVPLNPHRKHEIIHWLMKTHEIIKRRFPKAHVIIYSDYSMYFEVPGLTTKEALKQIRVELAEETDREGLVTFTRNGDSAMMTLQVGGIVVPLGKFKFTINGHEEIEERRRRVLRR